MMHSNAHRGNESLVINSMISRCASSNTVMARRSWALVSALTSAPMECGDDDDRLTAVASLAAVKFA